VRCIFRVTVLKKGHFICELEYYGFDIKDDDATAVEGDSRRRGGASPS